MNSKSRTPANAEEVMIHFSISEATLYRWEKKGMPKMQVEKRSAKRYYIADIERWLKNKKNKKKST